jgi:long-chain acyl-CoA synthetase
MSHPILVGLTMLPERSHCTARAGFRALEYVVARHLEYPDIPFHALLAHAAERWPEKVAISFQGRDIRFRELDEQATRAAGGLVAHGLRPQDRVALLLPNCPEYAAIFFGCTRANLVPSPLNPSYKEREVRHQVSEAGARALVVHISLWPVVEQVRHELPSVETIVVVGGEAPAGTVTLEHVLSHGSDSPPDVLFRPDDLAVLPFSSGTTGTSKGVMLTQRNVVCNTHQFADTTRTTEADVVLIFLPLYHIYGVSLMSFSIAMGARQILLPRFDLSEIVRLIEQEQVTELYVVPPVMLALANAPDLRPEQFRSLRFIMSAAAPLPPDVARRVYDRLKVPVVQAYGMTETSPLTHMVPLDRPELGFDTVGVVAADTRCRIMDLERGERELQVGEVGEVVLAGPQIMAGYWNAPAETARVLRGGWLYSGDVGCVDGRGNLSIVDRKKEMIKYKAFSIAPAELEAVLLEHPAVADCAVTAMRDEEAGEVPRAYVVLRPGQESTPDELQEFVRDRVAGYKQIRRVDILDSIPRTPSGKILRRMLKEQAQVGL